MRERSSTYHPRSIRPSTALEAIHPIWHTAFMPDETPEPRPQVVIYTDGACDPNPGIGGWAAIMLHPVTKQRTEISGGDPKSTNNRMELQAVIEALTRLKGPCD